MDERERASFIEEIVAALEEAGAPEGAELLDLMRAEQELVDVLAVLRRQIAAIVRRSTRQRPLDD
jgi:hypothetical protein